VRVGLLRGDELVADYLARLGEAAAELPAPDRTWLVEAARRRIRERAGGPGTRDEALVEVVLRELGEPERVVAAVRGDDATAVADDEPGAGDPERSAEADTAPFPPLLADTDPHLVLPPDLRVRPAPAHVDAGPDLLTSVMRVKLELAALVALVVGPTVLGLPGLALALGLVAVARFWTLPQKVAATAGIAAAGLLLAVVGAWLRATQLQESHDPGTRIATAGQSLAESMHTLPAAVCWVAAIYLGYVLVRDPGEHGRA
jgi:hypothetical protein